MSRSVKASEQFDLYPSSWTEYVDTLTARNWILSNELTVIVRTNLKSGETKYCIPEDEIEYWTLDYTKETPVRMQVDFSTGSVHKLIWAARIRHYDRIVRLTRPNEFEKHELDEVPHFRLFVFEFLKRLRLFENEGTCFVSAAAVIYVHLFTKNAKDHDFVETEDMTRLEVVRYASCLELVPLWLYKVTGIEELGVTPYFLDCCACLLVQFIITFEKNGFATPDCK